MVVFAARGDFAFEFFEFVDALGESAVFLGEGTALGAQLFMLAFPQRQYAFGLVQLGRTFIALGFE